MKMVEYDRLVSDSRLMEVIPLDVYLGWNRIRDPKFCSNWPQVPAGEREIYRRIGLEILRLQVDNLAVGGYPMNICDYERIARDSKTVDRLASASYFVANGALDPNFRSDWGRVPEDVKAMYGKLGLIVVHTLVDDYTTPGCICGYCKNPPKRGATHGKPIMCDQRWDALPLEARLQISESMSD